MRRKRRTRPGLSRAMITLKDRLGSPKGFPGRSKKGAYPVPLLLAEGKQKSSRLVSIANESDQVT